LRSEAKTVPFWGNLFQYSTAGTLGSGEEAIWNKMSANSSVKQAVSLQFPKGFLWGTATSAHQVEGGQTNNDWWATEQIGGYVFKNQ